MFMKEALNDFGMKGGCPARRNRILPTEKVLLHTLNNSECTPDTKADWKLKECMFHMFLLKHISFSVAMIGFCQGLEEQTTEQKKQAPSP